MLDLTKLELLLLILDLRELPENITIGCKTARNGVS